MRFDFDDYAFADRDQGGERPAVATPDGVLSWDDLAGAVTHWQDRARAAGAHADAPIVIEGHKEAAFFVAMTACLAAGWPYVPIDAINPPERRALITREVGAGLVYDAGQDVFTRPESGGSPLPQTGVAYVMFTSGSTGTPKGAMIGRESVSLFAHWIADTLALGGAPVFLDQMLYSFDFSLFSVAGALATGGCAVLASRALLADRPALSAYQRAHGVQVWACSPSFLRQQLQGDACTQHTLPTLAVCVVGAEALVPALADTLWSAFPAARLINSYGPTEATCSTTWIEIDAALRHEAPAVFPVGHAKPYAEVFLDNCELCIAGAHVMRGYLNRPELNAAQCFTHHGQRAYRSGDLASIDEQGRVSIKGRADDQIKMHGYRIELAEIDAALARLPGVRAGIAVALRRSDRSIVRLVGILEVDNASATPVLQPLPATMSAYKALLARWLPPYMVPSELLLCSRFPLSNSHKTDRQQLASLYLDTRMSATR